MSTVGLVIVSEPLGRREFCRLRRPLSLMMEDLMLERELRIELRVKEPGRKRRGREGGGGREGRRGRKG